MPKKFVDITYFVHGTTIDNEKELLTGWQNGKLSTVGIKQSESLRDLIRNKKFDVVFCSDLGRAIETSEIVFGKRFKIISDSRLRERNYGDLTGHSSKEAEGFDAPEKKFPNGESYKNVEKRIRGFLKDLLKECAGKKIAIVAHRAPQLALEVILNKKIWEQVVKEDWRLKNPKEWKPGWHYKLVEDFKTMKRVVGAVGNTPLVRLDKNIFAKLEFLNPSGSMKDRVAKEIILQAEKKGFLNRKKTVLEISGGNAGIAFAMACREKGYNCEIILPNHSRGNMARIIRHYDGKVVVAKDYFEAEKLAAEILEKNPEKYFYADQSKNPATINANKKFGKEILSQFGEKIDFFVAASGTGGTICGVSSVLKKAFPKMQAIAVLPEEKTKIAGVYNFEKSFKTKILEKCGKVIDKTIVVSDKAAFAEARRIRKKFGVCVGPTSGMNYHVAKKLKGNVIIIFADSSGRYEDLC